MASPEAKREVIATAKGIEAPPCSVILTDTQETPDPNKPRP
jgi:hypothetical protein